MEFQGEKAIGDSVNKIMYKLLQKKMVEARLMRLRDITSNVVGMPHCSVFTLEEDLDPLYINNLEDQHNAESNISKREKKRANQILRKWL